MGAQLTHELGLPVDVHSLNDAPVPFGYEGLRRGRLIFSRDREEAFRFAERILALYRDFLPLLEASYRDLLAP
jgi:predicted nucleotidyltransferase